MLIKDVTILCRYAGRCGHAVSDDCACVMYLLRDTSGILGM